MSHFCNIHASPVRLVIRALSEEGIFRGEESMWRCQIKRRVNNNEFGSYGRITSRERLGVPFPSEKP